MSVVTDPATVAAGLSKAQRQALMWPPADGSWSVTRAYWRIANSLVWLERHHPELAECKSVGRNGVANDLRHRLTPLGLAVRKILEAQDG